MSARTGTRVWRSLGNGLSPGEASGRDAAVARQTSPLSGRRPTRPGLQRPDLSFPDTKPAVVSVTGGDVEKELWPEPEQGVAAGGEESHGGAGAAGPVDDENQTGGGCGEEPPQQQQDEAQAAAEGPQERLHLEFTRLQLKELESVFQRTQYPDVFAR